ncbi:MAG TPA: metalloregulator ArsR/SmtB family transcription factor [Steroidobacteraceae bacterium]|jgi:ArsR family transcriptional regulator
MFKGSLASEDLNQVVRALKSAAEPTRLRLMVLLSHAELTVGELCQVLDQSQPRISRHLRVLTEAGFLDRFREQQCVYYRAPVTGRELQWSRQLLSMLDPHSAVLKHDRERAAEVVLERANAATRLLSCVQPGDEESDSRDHLSKVLLEELGPSSIGELLDIGTGSGLMLEILGPRAQHAVGVDISAPALRLARTRVHGVGLSHCEFRRGDMYRLPCEDRSFDIVTIDRVLTLAERPVAALAEAARALRPDGRLVIIEDFELLAAHAEDNPFAQIRRWLAGGGLVAGRMRPCDLASRHFLVALARHSSQSAAVVPATLRYMVSA